MPVIFIGIDPGQSGAVAFIHEDSQKVVYLEDMPLMPNNEVNAIVLMKMFDEHLEGIEYALCALEKSQPMPQQSAQSGFNYGVGYGVLKAVLSIKKIPFQEIPPIKWKKAFSLPKVGDDKKRGKQESITKCLELFPDVDRDEFYGPKGGMRDGRAEALLLAEYARRYMN